MPWFAASDIAGVHLAGRRRLARLVRQPGALLDQDRDNVAAWLASRLPAA